MRYYGSQQPTLGVPTAPDTVLTLLIAGSSGQAFDWPEGSQIVRFTGQSTAGAQLNFEANLSSTKAAAPSSGLSTLASSAQITVFGERVIQIPGGSTGGSVAALSSGYVSMECWRL